MASDPAVVVSSELPAVPTAGGGLGFAVLVSDGRGSLTLRERPLSPLAAVRDLALEVPDLRLPADLAGGADRFRNRRCRLTRVTLATDLGRLDAAISSPERRRALEAAGIVELRLRVSSSALIGTVTATGRAAIAGHEADFTARVQLSAAGPRKLRLALDDIRLYGFLPVPARFVASAVLTGLFGGAAEGGLPASALLNGSTFPAAHGRPRPAVRWSLELDPLNAALIELFAAHGWRLPDADGARLASIDAGAAGITLGWTTDGAAAAPTPAPAGMPDATRFDGGDALLGRGDIEGALAAYRRCLGAGAARRAPEAGGDPEAAARILELLVASPSSLGEAAELARAMAGDAGNAQAALALAVVAAERGDREAAATAYERAAAIADERGEVEDALHARLAAAEQWLRGRRIDRAGPSLEKVLAARPGHPRALALLDAAGDGDQRSQALQILGNVLVAKGDLPGADRVLASRLAIAPDAAARASIETDRARLRLQAADDVAGAEALAMLRGIPLDAAPDEALLLRADLGQRQGMLADAIPALNELGARARRNGDDAAAQRLDDRVTELLARSHTSGAGGDADAAAAAAGVPRRRKTPAPRAPAASIDALEEALIVNPTDPATAEELAEIYAGIPDPRGRADALSGLLRRALGLSPDKRKALYADLGASAEATGDLDRAERAYWRAATIEAEPALRANFLVSHARVLLARGDVQTAIGELEEALSRVPDHAGALALLAELCFRTEDWTRARHLYRRLEVAAGSADVISRELLMYRRALLAEVAGSEAEAETYFREVAILNPRHVDARRSLAEIALRRGDFGGAALRLEEVLRLLPLDALEPLLETRQRLGGIYVQLQDWGSARYYVELVLAQDPGRIAALELLVEIYLRLMMHREAARACEQLSRLYVESTRRAEILYRQGEILRAHVGDGMAALDAFLKSSDLDPRFAPTLVRLVDAYWAQGDFDNLAEVAGELGRSGAEVRDVDLGIRLAIATAMGAAAGEDATMPPAPPPVVPSPFAWDTPRVARALAEAAGALGARPPEALAPALAPFIGGAAATDGTAARLFQALGDLVQEDPCRANMGATRVLALLADAAGETAIARAIYSLLVFVDPRDPASGRLAELGPAPAARPRALAADGETSHPRCAGPLRAVLHAMATPFLGWDLAGGPAATAAPPDPTADEPPLSAARAASLHGLADELRVPPFVVAMTTTVTTAGTADRGPTIQVLSTRPATLSIAADIDTLPDGQWRFLAAQALDGLRTGMTGARELSSDQIPALLEGIETALIDIGEPAHPLARAVRSWLTEPDRAGDLPTGDERWRLLNDVRSCRLAPTDWEAFRRACGYTAQRIGLLACGHPLDALRALAREDLLAAGAPAESDDGGDKAGASARRRQLLKTPALRELIRYMRSPDYAAALPND